MNINFFFLFVLPSFSFTTNLLCNPSWCPSSSRGDGICDPQCMTSFCNFDSNSTTSQKPNPENSDCYQSCISNSSCLPSNLGNGICDQTCNNPACGYDFGDCGYCASDCKKYLGFQGNLSKNPNSSCDNENCYFGLGSFKDCSPDCKREMLGDGMCDRSCNVSSCNYDFGDCNNNQCNPDCELWMIGDNNCNKECNNQACNWDGGDCDCSQGCHSYMKGNGVCDSTCDNLACDYDGGDCQKCAPGCLKSMLGDGVCNSACNVSDCHYDNYDCGCSDGCGIESYGQCKDSCMNSFCRYDTIKSTSQCQNTNLVLFALHYGFIFKNLTTNVSTDNCTSTSTCTVTMLLDQNNCYSDCRKATCINSWNKCSYNWCSDGNCQTCNSWYTGDCFKCKTNTYQFYGFCLTSCPGGHEAVNFLGNYPVCLVPKDNSTKDNPAVFYVTAKTSTDKYEGNGTFSNPFGYLSLALASIYNKYATIYLLNDGTHYLTCVNTNNPVSTVLSDVCNPLYKSFNITNLVISPYDNTTLTLKLKPDNKFFTFFLSNTTTLTIKNIVFNGEDILAACPKTNPYCSYCANITLKSDGYYYSDNGTKVSVYLNATTTCSAYRTKNIFNLYFGSKLTMRNVNFTNWRMELKSLITSYGGNITFTNVNFDNIRCYWNQAVQPGQSTSQQGKYAVIYFLDCGDPNYNCGSFDFTNGIVTRLNNGYEYGAAQFSGFLAADKIRTVKLKNVTFTNNFVYYPYYSSTVYSLIKLGIYRSIEISHCVFEKNAVNYGLIYLEPLALVFRNDMNCNNEIIDLLLYHVYIHDSYFKNNYGEFAGILSINYQSQLQKILLDNLYISGNGVLSGPLILINNQYFSPQYITDTLINITDTKNNLVEAVFKKRNFVFKSSVITNNYSGGNGIFDISQLANLQIYNMTVESNGSLDTQNINTILWNYYVNDTNIYTKSLVSNSNSIDCLALWSVSSCSGYEIYENTFKNNICQKSCPSINHEYIEDANITDCIFEGNSGSSENGICILSAYAGNMRITSSTFINNTNSDSKGFGALCFLESLENIAIENTIILNNSANYSSGIYFEGGSLMLNNVTLESNKANSGLGAVYFSVFTGADTHKIDIKNSVFKENESFNVKAGAIYVAGSLLSQDPISLSILDSNFLYNSAPSGSAIYIENNAVLTYDSVIDSCIFSQNTAQTKGTIANYFEYGILNISNSLFISNHAELGSALYFAASEQSTPDKSKVILSSCTFTYNTGKNVLCTDDMAIYSYIETVKCLFQKNEGLAIYLVHDYWKDTESIIANSTITAGTVYLTSNATADCELTTFTNNTSTQYAGAIRAEGNSYFHCDKCTFYQNSAEYGGVLYFDQLSYFSIENSKFSNNFCTDKGAVIYVIGSKTYSVLKNSTLYNNHAESEGLIYSLTSNIQIDSCRIYNNTANRITPGIYLTLSNATINNSKFRDQAGSFGSFIYLTSDSGLTATNTSFKNGKSFSSGGSIYALSSSVTLVSSKFTNSTSTVGNSILAFSTALNISQCQFFNTYSSGSGGVINIFGNSIFIEKSFFENFTYSAVDGSEMESLKIIGTSFKNSVGKVGGAVSSINSPYIYIDSCYFNNNTSIYGGALYSTFTSNTINNQSYEIISTEFVNNTSSAGGAIYLDNINIDIKLCSFYENKAFMAAQKSGLTHDSGLGGAIDFCCSYEGECNFNVISNIFEGNVADYEGGAIEWYDVMPKFVNNSFENNKAIYGENIASYPVNMKIINNNWTGQLNDLASGQLTTTPLIIGLIDHMGSIVATDNSSVGELISLSQDIVLSDELKVTAINGTFTFSSFIISAEPGSNFSIEIQTNGIDTTKNIKANDGLNYNSTIIVDISLRDCVLGEAKVGSNCVVCPKDFYSINPKSEQCLACPDEAICYGNYTMVPKPGYWRSDMLSTRFWSCPYSESCIGSDLQNISYTGKCLEGYTGNLCQSCKEGYTKAMKNQCAKCQSLTIIIIKTSGIGLGFIVLSWLMIRMSTKSAYRPKSLSSVYIKIFINYIQLIALTTTFSLSWPNYVKQLFSVQNNASFISDQIFSFDCLLYYYQDLRGKNVIFYQKLFIMAVLPIFIPFIAAICWSLISLCKRSFALFMNHIVTTSIVVAFLIHPSLIKYYFSSFDCTELDYGKDWLVDDLNVRCWDGQHVFYITAISFPAILLWGIGIPTACLFLITKNRDKLSNINIRLKYGFLFNGYKARSYYWEFVIIYRKIVIISCSVFLATVSVNIQALTALFVLVACLYFQCKIKPYNGDDLNRLEAISISASAITIYCGMYYLTGTLDWFTEVIFFIAIISANLYFVIYWGIKAGNAYITMIIEKVPFLKKKFHSESYNVMSDSTLRSAKTSRIGESARELMLKSFRQENLNPQRIPFKEISIMDIFLRNLKGELSMRNREIEEYCYEENGLEKKSIEENDSEKDDLDEINLNEKSFEENYINENHDEESDIELNRSNRSEDEAEEEEEEKIDFNDVVVLDEVLLKPAPSEFSLVINDL